MKLFKSVTFVLSLLSFLTLGTALANEPTTDATSADSHAAASEPAHGEGNHHNTNFFPKLQPNKDKGTRLPMVELLEPKALSKVSGGQVTLKWKEVAGADAYRIQVATDPNFKWLVNQTDFHKETSLAVTGLQAGKHYFWRVYAWKTNNDPSWMSGFAKFSSFEAL